MAAHTSESLVLKSYPFGEADLIVSYFTRDHGKLRGVAKRARRPKSNFGSGLERLSQVRMHYYMRETRELSTIDSCELIRSPFLLQSSYEVGVGLDYLAEVSEELLPPHEPQERFFRLLLALLEYLEAPGEPPRTERIWPAVLYFQLWAVRLSGFLPELQARPESIEIAREMFEKPIRLLTHRPWTRTTASELRQFLTRVIEEQVERRLQTPRFLETL